MRRDPIALLYTLMETNSRLDLARTIVEKTGTSLFLTGKAGTGKTTFLKELRATSRKRMVVTAPTGIAAINAGGVTLHSFFQLDFGPYVPGMKREGSNRRSLSFSKEKISLIRGMDLLVIDEVSMVRSDVLDAVDDVLRRYRDRTLPFGGVQLLLIGDLQQLPPVVGPMERDLMKAHYRSPYFFDSTALASLNYVTIELTQIYRQSDPEFIELLNAVRTNSMNREALELLNTRYIPNFNPSDEEGYIRVTTHNHLASEINARRMAALPTPSHFFDATVGGNFPESSYPAALHLELKEGAQVMFIKNDVGIDRQYFNGMLGRVTQIDENGIIVTATETGEQIGVEPVEWQNVKFEVNDETKEITEKIDGVFRQLPLRPAWAITIHKSQGLTFDRAIIDATLSFTHGQTYVALSRCRSLDGLVLERPLPAAAIISDSEVDIFVKTRQNQFDESKVDEMVEAYRLSLIKGMFLFRPLFGAAEGIIRLMKENFMNLYPKLISEVSGKVEDMQRNLVSVGERFCHQIDQLARESAPGEDNPRLTQRIKDACGYFGPELLKLHQLIASLPTSHDNKKVEQKLSSRFDIFDDIEAVHTALFSTFLEEEFTTDRYLDVKAHAAFRNVQSRNRRPAKHTALHSEGSNDNPNPILLDNLLEWRRVKADELKVPNYVISSTKTLIAISKYLPTEEEDLLMIPGLGPTTIARVGTDILKLVTDYKEKYRDSLSEISIEIPAKAKSRSRSNGNGPRKKGDSARESLKMWEEGKTVAEIAQERGLVESTITGHIMEMADLSDPEVVARIISPELHEAMCRYYEGKEEVPRKTASRMDAIEASTGMRPDLLQIAFVEREFPKLKRILEDPEETTD